MISSKVVITYKRKRPLSEHKRTGALSCANSSFETSQSVFSTILHPKADRVHSSEKQNAHDGKRVLRGKRLCTACVGPHDSGKAEHQNTRETKKAKEKGHVDESEIGSITLRSRKVLLKPNSCEKNASSNSKDCLIRPDVSFAKTSDSTLVNPCSNPDSGLMIEQTLTGGRRNSHFSDMDTKVTRPICQDSVVENTSDVACHSGLFLERSSGKIDPPKMAESSFTGSDSHVKKFSNPLITFSRRVKRNRVNSAVDENNMINGSRCSMVESSKYGCNTINSHGVSQNCNSVEQSIVPEMKALSVVSQVGRDEISCKEEDCIFQFNLSGSAPKTEIRHAADVEENNYSQMSVCPIIVGGVQNLNADQHLPLSHSEPDNVQEEHCPFRCREISSTNLPNEGAQSCLRMRPAKVTSTCTAKKSEGSSRINNMQNDSLHHLELSVAPPGSRSPSKHSTDHNLHTSEGPLSANCSLDSDRFLANNIYSTTAIGQSRCDPCDGHTGPEKHQDSSNLLDPSDVTAKRGNVLELAEIPDRPVKETCYSRALNSEHLSSSATVDIRCEQVCDGKDSSGLSVNISLQNTRRQGRIFLPQSGVLKSTNELSPTRAFPCTPQFLALSLPRNASAAVDSVKGSVDIPSTSFLKSTGHSCNQQMGWQDMQLSYASDENLAIARQRQAMDISSARVRLSNGRQESSFEVFNMCANQWSEEELDFLWIGVRRHGRDNWDAMLRDPKLHFSGKVAEDLVEQWNIEQSKLLNCTLAQSVKQSRSSFSQPVGLWAQGETGARYGVYCSERQKSKILPSRTETELSLGDMYIQKDESIWKRYPFHLPGSSLALPLSKTDSSEIAFGIMNSALQSTGSRQQKPIKNQRTRSRTDRKLARYDGGFSNSKKKPGDWSTSHVPWNGDIFGYGNNYSSISDDMPSGFSAKGNLPHWLREVLSVPQRPIGLTVPSSVSAIAHSVSLLYNDKPIIPPFSDPCMMPLPPKDPLTLLKKSNTNIAGQRVSDVSTSVPTAVTNSANVSCAETKLGLRLNTSIPASESWTSDQKICENLNQICSNPLRQTDLIVIESDASSEETISDDRSGMS